MAQTRSGPEIRLTIQFAHFLRSKKTRSRITDRTRFQRTQPEFPHRQVLHEGDYRMHQRHRPSQLQHFLNLGSHFWILADEVGRAIPTIDGFHHSRERTISLGNFTDGTSGVPCVLSATNGGSPPQPPERDRLHRRPPDSLRHP